MELGYKGKVVGVTGAASKEGIGFCLAKNFLLEGARVFLCDLREDAVLQAKELLAPYGRVEAYACDVSSKEQVDAMFERAKADFGRVDVFVSNAGIYPQAALCEMNPEQWDQVMNVNLKSVFLCGCKARELMESQGGGVIINAASYAALIGSAGSGAYAASKTAVYSLTKTMAAEFAPFGIRVNGFIPGVIQTGMTRPVIDQRRSQMEEQIALGKLGTPQDVANAVLFLASDAAQYITGTFLEISGGKLCVQNPDYGYRKWKGEAQ